MNIDMNKIKDQMKEHWDMDAATFDAHAISRNWEHSEGWNEIEFSDANGKPTFFIESDKDDEVWHFDWIH
jgi:hypothetical protein